MIEHDDLAIFVTGERQAYINPQILETTSRSNDNANALSSSVSSKTFTPSTRSLTPLTCAAQAHSRIEYQIPLYKD